MTTCRGVVFDASSVRSVTAGMQTVARRPLRPQPEEQTHGWLWRGGPALLRAGYGADYVHTDRGAMVRAAELVSPYGAAGGLLYVKEQWRPGVRDDGARGIRYAADDSFVDLAADSGEKWLEVLRRLATSGRPEDTWLSARNMPVWAARTTLKLASVRVERLHDITEEDAKAEGMTLAPQKGTVNGEPATLHAFTHRQAYIWAWDCINNGWPVRWAANPWVTRLEFKLLEVRA